LDGELWRLWQKVVVEYSRALWKLVGNIEAEFTTLINYDVQGCRCSRHVLRC
jgi:hypothetical protein